MGQQQGTPVGYRMENLVNGKPIVISGTGELSDQGLHMDLEVSEVPADWSSIIVPCICSGPGPSPYNGGRYASKTYGLMEMSDGGYRTSPGTYRLASLFNEAGVAIAAVKAQGVYAKHTDRLDFQIAVTTKTAPGNILPKLTRINHYSFTAFLQGPGNVEVVAHYSLATDTGERVFGWTHIYYEFIGASRQLAAPIVGSNDMRVNVDGAKLTYHTFQRVRPIAELGQVWI